ncbi:unnamed protein product [Scytosiphon promiscuus]
MGIPCSLIRRIFSSFARRLKSSGSWSRVLNEAPQRRIDALGLFSGLALTCRATINDKLAIMFALFDPSESGTLTEDDLGAMVSSCASFLHHLGLSNPISNDEAAFAAGAAFDRQQAWAASSAATLCGTTSSEPRCYPDEIHFLAFSNWARSAELPTRAMGLLELPHRFSRVVDLVSAKAGSLLRERFLPWMNGSRGVSTKVHAVASNHQCAEQRAPASSPVASAFAQRMAVDRRQRGNSVGLDTQPFVLSPFLRRIGPHGASITLEVGRNGAPADHRLRMSWGVASRTSRRKDHAIPQSARHPGAKRTTFRFTTLPADSAMMALPSQNPAESLSTGTSPAACRRCIKLVSMEDARSWDALQLFRVETVRTSKGGAAHGGYVSVFVRHEHVTSVDSPEDNDAVDPWWASCTKSNSNALMSRNKAGSDMLLQSWPPPPQIADSGRPPSPTATTLEDVPPLPTASSDTPFDRELRERNTEEAEGEDQHQFWPGKNSGGSGDIDLMVHLRPNWLAVEAIRRCFRILEQCRLQSLAIRGDGRRLVTSEISTAIRSLLSKSFHLQRRTSQDRARRTCAHTILGGVKNPWLGLGEDELMMHNKEHRNIIRREVESVLQTYLLSEGADTGARDGESEEVPPAEFLSNGGGMMAIGSRCFLIRPRRQRSNRDGDLPSPPIVVDDPGSATASTIPSEITSGKGVRAGYGSVVGTPASTTDDVDGEVGRPRRKRSQAIVSEQDITLRSNALQSERTREISSIAAVNADRAATAEDDALARRDGPASPSTVDNDDHEINNASNQALQEVTEEERRIHLPQRTVEAERIAGASSGETEEVGGGSMVPVGKDGISKGEVGEAGGVTAGAKSGAKDSPTSKPEDGDGCGMNGAGAGVAGAAPGDLALRESVGKPKMHGYNAALKVLLLDMSRAAEALLPAPARTLSASGGDGRQLDEETTGCTAVIFLDAPLITPGLCRAWTLLRSEREETAVLRRTSALAEKKTAGLEDGAVLDVDTRAPPQGNDASDVEPLGTSAGQHNDEGSRDALDPHEKHPAGLGDPNKALEALLLWIEEGESSGLGRREVLLLCPGADPAPLLRDGPVQHRESESRHSTTTLEAHPGSVDDHGQEGSGSREESDAGEAGRQALHKFLLRTQPVAPDAENVSRVAIIFPPSSPRAVPCEPSSPGEGKRGSSKAHPTTNPAPRNTPAPRELTRVLVGPVVGHVSPNSAVVLVEVTTTNLSSAAAVVAADGVRRKGSTGVRAAADAVGVQLMDTLTGRRREMFGGEWTGGQSGNGPQVFNFQGLLPGRRYTLTLLGVRRRDQVKIVEALEEILADVQTARPTSTATLTIGPMVDSTKAAQALYPLVMAEKEEATRKKGGSSLGAMALDVFRQLYRHAWEEPRMRKLLANTATTPSTAGAGDLILPLLRNFPPGWLPYNPGAHTNPLTSGDTKERMRTTTKRRPRTRTKKVLSACGRSRREGGVARALREVAGAAKQAADEYQGALLGGSCGPGAGSGVHRMSLGGAKGCGGPLPALQTWGGVGVLNVSVASSQVEWACGGRDAGRRLLSREAWAWLEDLFQAVSICRKGPTLKTLIVVTDSPLVWTSASSATAASAKKRCEEMSRNAQRGQKGPDRGVGRMHGRREKKGRSPFSFDSGRGSRDASPSWSAHPREAASLLSLLFSWAAAESDGNHDHGAPGSGATARETSMSGTPGKGSGVAGKVGRVFSIVCPATCVRMNVETYVKDSETGRVAVQWCMASKRSGDEALIPMSGSISPRFTFTHYPQADGANGPGATLIRPIPDPYAPCVKFLGLAPLGDSGGGSGGSGFAFGTLGPVLGEVGTSTARILVEVSVPMELHLTLRKSGTTRRDVGSESTGDWQQLTKVVQSAHRPVLFEVDGLIPDTRYIVDFAPLANASEFRASLRTRPIRPFSFRIAAFGGSRNPFGFLPSAADVRPKAAIVVAGAGVTAITDEGNIAITGGGEIGANGTPPSRERRLHRERWPFCAVDGSDSGMTVDLESRSEAKVESDPRHGFRNGSGSEFDDTDELFCAERRSAAAGGGWRHPGATALAITVATDGARLGEMRRDSLLGSGGSDDALSACAEFNRSSAWKSMADEVELPVQGLDLVIHLGNEVNAAASLNRADVDEIAETFASESRLPAQRPLTDTLPPMGGLAADKGGGRSLLVRPPQLPVESPLALGERDEEDVSQLEAFLVKLHDEAERDRKRGDGEFRHRRIVEPSLAIQIDSPEDLVDAQGSGASSGDVGDLGVESGSVGGAGNADHSQHETEMDWTDASERGPGGNPVGDAYAWSLAAEEVAERVRDPYRVAWGLPWARAVMSSAPNALLAYTPSDLDEGCQEQVHAPPEDQPRAGGPRTEAAAERGGGNQDVDHPASAGRVREERLRAWVQYQAALAPGGGGRGNAPPGSDTAAGGGDKGTGNRNNSDDAKGGEEKGNGKGGGGGGKSRVDKRETDRGAYREYGGIGVLMLDVWGNQPWRLDMAGVATAKGADEEDPGFHPKALLSKRQEKLVKKALASSSTNALIICSGTPLVAEPVVHPKAPPLSESEQKSRDKALSVARKELKKLGKAGLAEIQRMAEEEKIPKLAMLSPEEVGAMDAFYDESRPCFHWSYHSPYLQARKEATLRERFPEPGNRGGFLEKLFDWAIEGAIPTKKGQPSRKRDVVFLCGGTGCGVRTELRDRRSGLSFTQLCVGRMSDATVPCPWPLAAGSIGDRVIFTHRPIQHRETSGNLQRGQTPSELALTRTGDSNPAGRRSNGGGNGGSDNMNSGSISSFALVTVLSEPLNALMTAALVQPPGSVAEASPYNTKEVDTHGVVERRVQEAGVNIEERSQPDTVREGGEKSAIILGPVVGRVEVVRQSGLVRESCRVPVVIEVDREGEITCVMRDVATSETFREKRVLKARRPRAFWVQGLRPARRYAIEFEGVSNNRDRTGSLTTPDSSHPDLTMVAVSHDRPGELPSGGEANLWGALVERLRSPWHAVEAVIHVGGQVDLSNAFGDGKASLERLEGRRKAGKVSEEEEVSVMEAVKERLREEYRKVWNQPCTRKALASCQHIMMWGQGECCAGYGRGGHVMVSSWAGRRLLRLAQEVFHEYQRQLWDPLWGCPFKVGESESFYTTFLQGTVGILSLDSLELSPQWDSSRGSGSGVRKDESEGAVADRKMPDADPVNGARLGPRANAKLGESKEEGSPRKEVPLIGDSQWQRLKKTLEEQESLVTLIVVTETPIAWHDTETFLAEAQGADVGGSSDKPPPCLEDHWAARPIQQRALLMHLFQWKAEGLGREVILLAGAGLAEGCTAAETRLEYKMLPQSPSHRNSAGPLRTLILRNGGVGVGGGCRGERDKRGVSRDEPEPYRAKLCSGYVRSDHCRADSIARGECGPSEGNDICSSHRRRKGTKSPHQGQQLQKRWQGRPFW